MTTLKLNGGGTEKTDGPRSTLPVALPEKVEDAVGFVVVAGAGDCLVGHEVGGFVVGISEAAVAAVVGKAAVGVAVASVVVVLADNVRADFGREDPVRENLQILRKTG
nr:hypothetical protein BaRGS_008442 [Batillaria attramentaria]